ncbi:DUF2939 domain-containing protein [Rhodocytophaga rosea]|uniref:DUF2939 domain-containing protein n=1 Tax=Rhodocytophaga rosea TaxID=2704465 RepID=A0A6C0GS89_9BACT|nr:DUF2939 domain-containing protein [Rhodocytophaga rosea]QHT70926.1 DUF2939 domain-containing protein [Rhodocytophaga rosea]
MKMYTRVLPALLLVLAVVYFFIYKQMPEYSLHQIKKAAEQHDQEKFEKFVDVHALSESLAIQFISYSSADRSEELVDPALKRSVSVASSTELNRTFQEIVADYVQNGKYSNDAELGGQTGETSPGVMLMQLQDYIVSKLEFDGFRTIDKQDGFADVTADFYMPQKNISLGLRMKMADKGKHWQIVEIENLSEFLKQMQ